MASVVPHCSCNSASENHIISLSSCLSRRHSLSSPEFAGFGAAASFYKLKVQYVRADATVAVHTETSTSDAGTSSDAAMALSLAREAAQAAHYVFTLSNMHAYESDFISEADLLRLQRARLAEMELNLFEFNEDKSYEMNAGKDGTSSSLHLNEPCCCGVEENSQNQNYTRKGESVAVRSIRRKERLVKRQRANAKVRSTVVSVAATIDADILNKSRRQPKILGQRAMPDPIRSFLVSNGSGKAKLLTAAEEVNLSHKIQDLLVLESARKNLQMELGREPSLAEWAKAMHMKLCAFSTRLTEGQRSKETMIKCNLRLVISVARKYEGKGLSVQDLIQEGSQGLIRGCEKFDPSKGFKFSTYAHWWIMQGVTRALLQKSRFVRMPSHVSDTLLRVRRAREILQLKYGVCPSDADVARYVGITMERLRVMSNASRSCKSMDKPVGRESNMNLGDMIPDLSIHPSECKFMKQLLKEDVDVVLRTLKPKEREVMRLRYGLDDGKRRTLEEIGRIYHVTRERIRQIECKAMIKLKDPERNAPLRDLLMEC